MRSDSMLKFVFHLLSVRDEALLCGEKESEEETLL